MRPGGAARPAPVPASGSILIPTLAFSLVLSLALGVASVAWAAQEPGSSDAPAAKSQTSQTSKSSKSSKSSTSASGQSKKAESKSSKKSGSKSSKKAATGGAGSFRNLAWGAPLSALADPDLREQDGDMRYYTVPGDDMVVHGVTMRELVYVFCKDKLAGVLARYDGEVSQLALMAKLTELYGSPLESAPNVRGDRSWRFDAQDLAVMMEYAKASSTGALAWFASGPLAPCRPGQ